jgi:3'-5' exoribonuclease
MENKGFYINDLPQSGEVTFLAAVIEKELRPKRNGGSFLSVRLADRSGELDAKAWDDPETVTQLFDCNDVVKVRGPAGKGSILGCREAAAYERWPHHR